MRFPNEVPSCSPRESGWAATKMSRGALRGRLILGIHLSQSTRTCSALLFLRLYLTRATSATEMPNSRMTEGNSRSRLADTTASIMRFVSPMMVPVTTAWIS